MGAILPSRNRVGNLEPKFPSNHSYTYPPPGGLSYFTSHYYLGSKKFETADPERFLYGELSDVNYLTCVPCPFPYKQPPRKKPIDCLNALIFLHKETVKLVKLPDSQDYTLQFKFDSDTSCNVCVLCSLSHLVSMDSLKKDSVPDSDVWISQKYSFEEKGLEKEFSEPSLRLPLKEFPTVKLSFDPENGQCSYPLVILMETSCDWEYQSLMTMCNLEKSDDGDYNIKVLRQKFFIDGLEYIFHEVFGLENKATPKEEDTNSADDTTSNSSSKDSDCSEEDDLGAECVICFTDVKDTLILPCRHFCLCASCAADLRYQASNCPICRAPFQALVQIQAVQKLREEEQPDDDEITNNPELYSLHGYKVMSLLQGLNGYPKIKKNACRGSAPPIMSTDDEEEGHEEGVDESHNKGTTPQETVIVIDPTSSDLEDEVEVRVEPTKREDNTSPLEDKRASVLPDLIPPGSIPGTPDTDEECPKPDGISMLVTANVEPSSDQEKSCSCSEDSATGSQERLLPKIDSSISTNPTEMSSLRSSSSFDSASSHDVLIGKREPTQQ